MLRCPKLLKLESRQGKEIALWINNTLAKYNECSALNDTKNKGSYLKPYLVQLPDFYLRSKR